MDSDLIRKIDILMNGVSMGRVSSVREIRDEVTALEAQLKEEKLQHGLTQISLDYRTTHLNSCEIALSDAHQRDGARLGAPSPPSSTPKDGD